MRFWSESKGYVAWLWIIIPILLVILLYRWNLISVDMIEDNKDFIDALSSLITILTLFLAGLIAYLKFFKGRLLQPKMVVEAKHGIVELTDSNLHWIDIAMENRGTVAIWNYTVNIESTASCEGATGPEAPKFHSQKQLAPEKDHVIHPSETAFEHATISVGKGVEAITLRIIVTGSEGFIWDRCLTVANKS